MLTPSLHVLVLIAGITCANSSRHNVMDLLRSDIAVRVVFNFDKDGSGSLDQVEFKDVAAAHIYAQSLLPLNPRNLEVELSASTLNEKVRALGILQSKGAAESNLEVTFAALVDARLACTAEKLERPFQKLMKHGAEATVQEVSIAVSRGLNMREDEALRRTMKSKDVDRAGTPSMKIKSTGSCLFMAKLACPAELNLRADESESDSTYAAGLPGLMNGRLMDMIRGDITTGLDLNAPVTVAALARFLGFTIAIAQPGDALRIAKLVDCAGKGELGPDQVALAIVVAYSEAVQRVIPPEQPEFVHMDAGVPAEFLHEIKWR